MTEEPKVEETMAGDATSEETKTERSIADELAKLGQQLAAAAKTAWDSEERKRLQTETHDRRAALRPGAVDCSRRRPRTANRPRNLRPRPRRSPRTSRRRMWSRRSARACWSAWKPSIASWASCSSAWSRRPARLRSLRRSPTRPMARPSCRRDARRARRDPGRGEPRRVTAPETRRANKPGHPRPAVAERAGAGTWFVLFGLLAPAGFGRSRLLVRHQLKDVPARPRHVAHRGAGVVPLEPCRAVQEHREDVRAGRPQITATSPCVSGT